MKGTRKKEEGMMEYWKNGIMEMKSGKIGMMEYWENGGMEYWTGGKQRKVAGCGLRVTWVA